MLYAVSIVISQSLSHYKLGIMIFGSLVKNENSNVEQILAIKKPTACELVRKLDMHAHNLVNY